jgi:putative hemolysin
MEELPSRLALFWNDAGAFFSFDLERLHDPDIIIRLIIQAVLFLFSAFFSGSETALFSLSRLDLQKLRRDHHPQTENLHALLDQPRRLIISILCGNELINVAATANMAGILFALTSPDRAGWINLLIMFPLILLLGEVTPKTIAVNNPIRVSASLVSGPMTLWVRFVTPLRLLIRMMSDRLTTLIVGEERASENILRTEVFQTLIEDVAEEGMLDATERILIDNLLEACETEVVEIMTPRTHTNFLQADMPVKEIVEKIRRWKHPRVPVYRENRDNLEGFIHAEDIMNLILDGKNLDDYTIEDLMHPPIVVPSTKNVDEMFDFFQDNRVRGAAVLNEFGGVDGFITMRDIINFIFGEISEDVSGQELYREQDNDVYTVPGHMKLTDFNDLTTFGIEDPRMTTIGGVVFRHLDRLPKIGDKAALGDGLVATVLEMEGHRMTLVKISQGRAESLDEDEVVPEDNTQPDNPEQSEEGFVATEEVDPDSEPGESPDTANTLEKGN